MSNLKITAGLSLIIIGIGVGLYVGVWLCFIGGMVQVINNCTPVVNALGIALGCARFLLSSVLGWLSFAFFFIPGIALLQDL